MRTRGGAALRSIGLAAITAGLAGVTPASAQDDGFGHDIPLSVAARQIVPQGYKVEMGSGVDGGANVSWNPGDWHRKISDAAASGGYVAAVSGQTVRISRKGAALDKVSQTTALGSDDAPAKPPRVSPSKAEHPERVSHAAAADDESRPEPAPRRAARHAAPTRVAYVPVRHVRRAEPGGGDEAAEPAVGPSVSASGFVLVPAHVAKVVAVADADEPHEDGWKPVPKAEGRRAAPVAAKAVAPPSGFDARKDDNLATVLQDWAAREGWKVEWKSEYSYRLTTSARFQGDFVQATTELLRSMTEARPQPTAEFYRGNKVLVIDNGSRDETAAASN